MSKKVTAKRLTTTYGAQGRAPLPVNSLDTMKYAGTLTSVSAYLRLAETTTIWCPAGAGRSNHVIEDYE